MKRYLFFISLIILAFQPLAVNAGSVDWATLNPELSDATYVKDDQKCLECHEEYMEPYSKTIHAKTFKFAARNGSEGLGCENCHGPLSKHLDAPKKSPPLVVSFKKERGLTSQQKSSICLQCHEGGKRALWLGGIHDKRTQLQHLTLRYGEEKRSVPLHRGERSGCLFQVPQAVKGADKQAVPSSNKGREDQVPGLSQPAWNCG